MVGRIVGQALVRVGWLQLPRKRPLLQRGKQRIQRGQGAAVGGFEGLDGGDAGGEGLLEGEGGAKTDSSFKSAKFTVF